MSIRLMQVSAYGADLTTRIHDVDNDDDDDDNDDVIMST